MDAVDLTLDDGWLDPLQASLSSFCKGNYFHDLPCAAKIGPLSGTQQEHHGTPYFWPPRHQHGRGLCDLHATFPLHTLKAFTFWDELATEPRSGVVRSTPHKGRL